MFAIYTIEGRRLRDTLENLRKVRATQASHEMRLRSDVPEDETSLFKALPAAGARGMIPFRKARQAYKAMQEHHLQAVPIVDEQDALIGTLSRGDILRAVTNDPPLNM